MSAFIRIGLAALGLALSSAASAQAICSVNDSVNVYWAKAGQQGGWFPATVIRVNETQTQCYVRYKGYDATWDEWVGGDRLRRVGAPAAPAAAPAPRAAPPATNAVKYSIAHTRARDRNWVFVRASPRFFSADETTIRKWYTDVQACVRSVNLAGDVVVVANVNGAFRYWGPLDARQFLNTLDMNWVNTRVNKEMTCRF